MVEAPRTMGQSLEKGLDVAIRAARGFLQREQRADGGFSSYLHADRTMRGVGIVDADTPFETAFAVYSLIVAQEEELRDTIDNGVAFLARQFDDRGLCRYWSAESGKTIDADLDSTSCISWTLTEAGRWDVVPENVDIVLNNRWPDGLYKTWVRSRGAFNDVDGVVNANVLLYLGEREETRAVAGLLNRLVSGPSRWGRCWYYADPLVLEYAVSRAFAHGCTSLGDSRAGVVERLLTEAKPVAGGDGELSAGLAMCALANYGVGLGAGAVRELAKGLVSSQRADGSWPRRAFSAGPEPPWPQQVWWGSEALTTAVCHEALVKCRFRA